MLELDSTADAIPHISTMESISAEDLLGGGINKPPPSAVDIRASHHRVAAMLATDYKVADIIRRTGFSRRTIDLLTKNPAFQDLIAHYTSLREERMGDIQSRVETTACRLLDELDSRMDDPEKRDKVPFHLLADATMKMLDRAGQGPMSRSESKHVNLNISTDAIAEIRTQAAQLRFASEESVGSVAPLQGLSEGGGSGVGKVHKQEAMADSAPVEGVDSKGRPL